MTASSPFCREAWLVVAQGGWWHASEILAAVPAELSGKAAANLLWWMARHGYLVKRDLAPDERPQRTPGSRGPVAWVAFAVTSTCEVPRGLTAGQISNVLLGREFA